MGIWISSNVFAIMNYAAMNIIYKSIRGLVFSFFLSR